MKIGSEQESMFTIKWAYIRKNAHIGRTIELSHWSVGDKSHMKIISKYSRNDVYRKSAVSAGKGPLW